MYKWYHAAAICSVFLPDVSPLGSDDDTSEDDHVHYLETDSGDASECLAKIYTAFSRHAFTHSIWFKRGWTLQELIAPDNNIFYNTAYEPLGDIGVGTPLDHPLVQMVEKVTGIDPAVLVPRESVYNHCVAGKMSWTKNRQTTREEDIAVGGRY